MNSLIFVIDFDGTVVSHEFEKIGKDIGAVPVLKRIVDAGHRLILHTMRSDNQEIPVQNDQDKTDSMRGNYLTDAVNWFKENDIPLWGIQSNPEQSSWTSSNKPHGDFCIDDRNIGCPLIHNEDICSKPFVNWERVEDYLVINGYLTNP